MINNQLRIGRFTSSEIWKLMVKGRGEYGFGEKATTYIKEKNLEIKLGRSIRTEAYSKAIAWGTVVERYVFEEKLGLEYELLSKSTDVHPTIPFWSGSKDLIVRHKKIGEIKCYEPKHFAEYTDALLTGNAEFIKQECPEEYWQMVSNAILNQVPVAEAISFIPYKSELAELREFVSNYDCTDPWKYRFIVESDDEALPHIPDESMYKSLNRVEFEIPAKDIELLTERVTTAGKLLITQTELINQ